MLAATRVVRQRSTVNCIAMMSVASSRSAANWLACGPVALAAATGAVSQSAAASVPAASLVAHAGVPTVLAGRSIVGRKEEAEAIWGYLAESCSEMKQRRGSRLLVWDRMAGVVVRADSSVVAAEIATCQSVRGAGQAADSLRSSLSAENTQVAVG